MCSSETFLFVHVTYAFFMEKRKFGKVTLLTTCWHFLLFNIIAASESCFVYVKHTMDATDTFRLKIKE
jgi:hypothetical protein